MNTPIKILIAEDHTIVRSGIVALLNNQKDIKIIGDVRNGIEILKHLKTEEHPDVVLTDIHMPDMNGIALIEVIKSSYPKIKILILTIQEEEKYIIDALDAGADGYLLKNVGVSEILFAINQIVSGQKYVFSGIAIKLLMQLRNRYTTKSSRAKVDIEISKRETEILNLIAQGYTNNEIAEKLFTSKRTIEGNRQNLLDKTGTRNTAALVNYAVRNGIID